ncbi:MAG TPA: hypothetical protein VL096_21350 [Pirellulaceae bacterium]|nr:hypothetical protein [Pirellulaceae bacterium]
MTEPTPYERELAAGKSWPRQCARASLIAPFSAILVQVLTAQMLTKQDAATSAQVTFISSSIAAVLIVSGFIASLCGFVGGRRERSFDTQVIACLGMLVSGGLLVVMIWAIMVVNSAK